MPGICRNPGSAQRRPNQSVGFFENQFYGVLYNQFGLFCSEIHAFLPVKLATADWESPHTKTHLLYQAHFSRMKLPVDYITDQRSIIESCIRIIQVLPRHNSHLALDLLLLIKFEFILHLMIISFYYRYILIFIIYILRSFLQAMFDFCLELSLLDTALNVLVLLQQIFQARWYWDHPLLCLPYLSAHSIEGIG
jgi:hypothetical protein